MMKIIFFWCTIAMLLSVYQVQCAQSQHNSKMFLNFLCYKNGDPDKVCADKHNYENCQIIIRLCVKSEEKRKDEPDLNKCEIFDRKYIIPNERGMCLKRNHDSREILGSINQFHATLNQVYIYIGIYIKPKIENTPILHEIMFHQYDRVTGKFNFTMDPIGSYSRHYIKIKLMSETECLTGFSGDRCEAYCINLSECGNGTEPICPKDWNKTDCLKVNFTGLIEKCKQTHLRGSDGSCSEDYKSCLKQITDCKIEPIKTISNIQNNNNVVGLQTSNYEIKRITIAIIVSGLFLIIIILLISVLLMWRSTKLIHRKKSPDNSSFLYFAVQKRLKSGRRNVGLPDLGDSETDPTYSKIASRRYSEIDARNEDDYVSIDDIKKEENSKTDKAHYLTPQSDYMKMSTSPPQSIRH